MQQFKQNINRSLANVFSQEDIRYFTYAILEKVTGLFKSKLLTDSALILSDDQRKKADDIISRLKNNEPIQYIFAECEFYGLTFKVNPSVLIPRPETEELVEWLTPNPPDKSGQALKGAFLDVKNRIDILDIGTGSGCIAISFKKKFPESNVSAMDISVEALTIAKENAKLNNVEINFIQADVLQLNELDKKYDIIVSNPPYIPDSDKKNMELNVLDFEPHTALFVKDEDPLIFYREIAELAKNHLTKNGSLYFEIHNEQGENCIKLLQSLGYKSISLRKDISGNDRMICAKRY